MNLLFLDTETSGLDPTKDEIIEVAGVLWSLEHRCTTAGYFSLVEQSSNAAEAMNKIPTAALARGISIGNALIQMSRMSEKADVVVSHYAEFDESFVNRNPNAKYITKPWVCSCDDMLWPNCPRPGMSLIDIALANGLAVMQAHRAMTDVMLMARLFERVAETGTDVAAMIQRALRPKGTFVGLHKKDQNELVKEHGFRWEPKAKEWYRSMAIEDVPLLPFKVQTREQYRAEKAEREERERINEALSRAGEATTVDLGASSAQGT